MEKFSKIVENLESKVEITSDYEEIQNDLIQKVKDTNDSDSVDLHLDIIKSYIEDEQTTIIGLINDSDVFDFYLKYRNEIDMVLAENNHFEQSPESIGINNSVYDYIVKSTKIAIQEMFKMMI